MLCSIILDDPLLTFHFLKRFIYPITRVHHTAVPEKRRHRATALNLCNKLLELRVIITPFQVTLHPCFQSDALPVRISFLTPHKHFCGQISLYLNIPLANRDTKILCNERPGNLVAGAQASQGIGDWGGMRLLPTENGIGIG